MAEFIGEPAGQGRRVVIVAARFNQHVTEKLVEGALDCCVRHGVAFEDVDVVWVPGAWELPPAVARALEVPLADLRAAAQALDVPAYVTADRTFHATIVAAEGNLILIRLYGSLRDRQLRMGAANLAGPDGELDAVRMRTTVADHEAIAAAIAHEDGALAEHLTREHLRHADRALRGVRA